MAKWKIVAIVLLVLLPALNREALPSAADAKELALQAEKKLDEGSRLAGQDKLSEAAAVYLQAAEIYEQALQKDPNHKANRQNYTYSLGERAMIYIRKGQAAGREKKYAVAADLYSAAIAAYDLALQKLPQEINFQKNRLFCRHEWGLAQFQVKLAAGENAYSFQLTRMDGAPLNLADMKGQVVLLEFAAGWCPSCRDSLPVLQELQKQFKAKRVRIVVLAVDRLENWKKSGSEAKIASLTKGMDFTAAWADEETYFQYGSFNSIPTVILINKAGRIVAQVPSDGSDREQLARRIAALL